MYTNFTLPGSRMKPKSISVYNTSIGPSSMTTVVNGRPCFIKHVRYNFRRSFYLLSNFDKMTQNSDTTTVSFRVHQKKRIKKKGSHSYCQSSIYFSRNLSLINLSSQTIDAQRRPTGGGRGGERG